jgi:ribose/xylose/arabinose/galactoside ABC-type transport system permease subunit
MTTPVGPIGKGGLINFARDHITYGIFALITLYFIAFAPHFASLSTASAVLRITAIVSVMAIGMPSSLCVGRSISLSDLSRVSPAWSWRCSTTVTSRPLSRL